MDEVELHATESPYLRPNINPMQIEPARSKSYTLAVANLKENRPLPSFYYQMHPFRRISYDPSPYYSFKTYTYCFTWEDPRDDLEMLKITPEDVIFCISSGGDNAIEYVNGANPHRVHCVDLNPCQNHLLELKLAAISSCDYSDIWKLFGEGFHEDFTNLLFTRLAPHLSSHAMQYWMTNSATFEKKGLYNTGASGGAIQIAKYLFRFFGVEKDVIRMCETNDLEEQKRIWKETLRPVIMHPIVYRLITCNPMFLWRALGVPMCQYEVLLTDQTMYEYIVATLDPIIERSLLSNDNYFYYLCLMGGYSQKSCPDYLKPESVKKLSASGALDAFRIHTDSIEDVLKSLAPQSITKVIMMDHTDWMDKNGVELQKEMNALKRALKPGGQVMLRSAGKKPWYLEKYAENGFKIREVAIRDNNESIDRVNMYASCWIAEYKSEASQIVMPELKLGGAALDVAIEV